MKWIIGSIVLISIGGILWWTVAPALYDVTVEDELTPELQALIEQPSTEVTTTSSSTPTSTPVSVTFPIMDTPGHPATGEVRVIETDDQTLVRYENYDGTNGPDLYVYLAKDLQAEEFVSLGRAKGNQGNINYDVPDDIDLSEYQYVMTWCRAFGVLFDYAELR